MTITRGTAAFGGVLVGLTLLALTGGSLFAQPTDPTAEASPSAEHVGMMDAATPAPGDASATGQADETAGMDQTMGEMTAMMEQCMAMMTMMMGMMGGDMGTMGDPSMPAMPGMGGMEGMPGMAAATPTAGG